MNGPFRAFGAYGTSGLGSTKRIIAEIQGTPVIHQVDRWLDAFDTARSIREIPFAAKK